MTAAAASDLGAGLPAISNTYYVAHLDGDFHVRLSMWNLFPGWTTLQKNIDPPAYPAAQSYSATVATLLYGKYLYIFYTSNSGLTVTTYNYVSGNLSTQIIDDTGGSQPTAVAAPDGLRVYYFGNGTLRGAHLTNGIWTTEVVDGTGFVGGTGGVTDTVGRQPAAIVFPVNNTVNVFYTDDTKQMLRIAQRDQSGSWHRAFVGNIDIQSYKATVIYGSSLEVYYEYNEQLQAAYGTGPNAMTVVTLDGGPNHPNWVANSVSDQMGIYANAVEVNGKGPSVFYWDTKTSKVRNASFE